MSLLGVPEVTANLYCNFCVSVLGRLRDLQYIFAVTSGSPSISIWLLEMVNFADKLPYYDI